MNVPSSTPLSESSSASSAPARRITSAATRREQREHEHRSGRQQTRRRGADAEVALDLAQHGRRGDDRPAQAQRGEQHAADDEPRDPPPRAGREVGGHALESRTGVRGPIRCDRLARPGVVVAAALEGELAERRCRASTRTRRIVELARRRAARPSPAATRARRAAAAAARRDSCPATAAGDPRSARRARATSSPRRGSTAIRPSSRRSTTARAGCARHADGRRHPARCDRAPIRRTPRRAARRESRR